MADLTLRMDVCATYMLPEAGCSYKCSEPSLIDCRGNRELKGEIYECVEREGCHRCGGRSGIAFPDSNAEWMAGLMSDLKNATPECDGHCVCSIIRLKFVHEIFDMKVDCGLGNCELICNLFVAISISNEPEDFQLSRC